MNKIYFFLVLLTSTAIFGMETEDAYIESKIPCMQEYSKEQLCKLVDTYPDDVNCRDEKGMTPLMYAVVLNDIEFIKNLVIHEGADSSIATPQGITAIDISTILGYTNITDFLISQN